MPALDIGRAAANVLRTCSGIAGTIGASLLRVGDTLWFWLERYRQRRALSSLSDHMLKDMGLSRGVAGLESAKRFWEE
jgi:uncharacterized protein YjiS (DUF1127 family)